MKLTVAIVTFQHEAFIRQALHSVLAQKTRFDFDVVIGDDASTDRTVEILKDIQSTAPVPIRLNVAETNPRDRGVTNFLNTVKAATGNYIALLDGDDYWTAPDKLQRMADFLDAHPDCALCAHRTMHLWSNGKTLLSPRPRKGDSVLRPGSLLYSNYADRVATVARRSAVQVGLPDWFDTVDVTSADWLFNILVGRNGKIGYVDEVMAMHRLHSDGLTMNAGLERMMADKLAHFDMLAEHLPGQSLDIMRAKLVIGAKLAMHRISPNFYMNLKKLRYAFHRTNQSEGKQ